MKFAKKVSLIAVALLCGAAIFLLTACNPVSSYAEAWNKAEEKSSKDTITIPSLTVSAGSLGLLSLNSAKIDIERNYSGSEIDFKVQVGYGGISGAIISFGLPSDIKNLIAGKKEKALYMEGSYNVDTDEISISAHAYFPDDSNPENRVESGKLSDLITTFASTNGISQTSLDGLADLLRNRYDLLAVYKFNGKLEKNKDVISGKFDPTKDDGYNEIIALLKPFVNELLNSSLISADIRTLINTIAGGEDVVDFVLSKLEFGKVGTTINIKDKKVADMSLTQKISGKIDKETVQSVLSAIGNINIPDNLLSSVIANGIEITINLASVSAYTY